MANQVPKNSVWSAMEYQPPRGQCNYKTGMLSSCPCLRFMLHPVKAATSFDCDGCGHHASFHDLQNEKEDAILKKWAETESNEQSQATIGAGKKRRRIAEKAANEVEIFEILEDDYVPPVASSSRQRTQRQTRKSAQTSSTQAAKPGAK